MRWERAVAGRLPSPFVAAVLRVLVYRVWAGDRGTSGLLVPAGTRKLTWAHVTRTKWSGENGFMVLYSFEEGWRAW